jgi:hypothetical protein
LGPLFPVESSTVTQVPAADAPPAVSTFDLPFVYYDNLAAVFPTAANIVDLESFRLIARWLWSPLLGFIGGLVALRLYHKRKLLEGSARATTG